MHRTDRTMHASSRFTSVDTMAFTLFSPMIATSCHDGRNLRIGRFVQVLFANVI